MAGTTAPVLFSRIDSELQNQAYAFHELAVQSKEYLLRRTEPQFFSIIENGEVYGAQQHASTELCGLCYLTAPDAGEYELGGLFVTPTMRTRGIGHALACFAIAHTVVTRRPWFAGDVIAAYVDEDNMEVRKRIEDFGFLSDEDALPHLSFGITYRRFVFPRASIKGLTDAFTSFFDRPRPKQFEIVPGALYQIVRRDLKIELREFEKV